MRSRQRGTAISAAGLAAVAVIAAGCGGGGSAPASAPQRGPTPPGQTRLPATTTTPVTSASGAALVSATAREVPVSHYRLADSSPRADSEYPFTGSPSIDALHYGLDLTWAAGSRQLSGTDTITFRVPTAESALSLDFAASLHARTVTLDSRAVPAAHPGAKLDVTTGPLNAGSRHVLEIRYAGTPHSFRGTKQQEDIDGVGWNTEPDGSAWTIQEPFGAYTWYAVNDQPSDKAFYDITWHTRAAWTGVSNGQLMTDRVKGGERTTHWVLDSPAASYLVAADIGPYREYRQTGPHGLPLSYWLTASQQTGLKVLQQTPAMLTWLEARLGRFPFSSLGDVVVPTHSAIETQTMVTMGSPVLDSAAARADLVHEYVHQWFGDEVTPSTWRDLWLNESFAYYLQLVWEASHGVTTTAAWMAQLNHDDQQLRTAYGPPGRPKPTAFAELNVYECGARMLARLNATLGAATFDRVLRDWPRRHRFGNVSRPLWTRHVNAAAKRDLTSFTNTWLLSPTAPT